MRLCGVSRCVPGARVIRAMRSAMRSSLRLSAPRARRGWCMWVSRGVLGQLLSGTVLWGRFGQRMWRRGVCMVRWRVLVWDLWRRRCSMGLRRRLRRAFSLITSKRYTFREHDPAAAAPVGQCVWEGGLWVRCAGESRRRCRGPPRGSRSSAALQGTSRKIDPPSLKTALPWRPRCLRPCASARSVASRSRRPSRWRRTP